MTYRLLPILIVATLSLNAFAADSARVETTDHSFKNCGDMEVRDVGMGMCMPLAMAGMPMKMFMLSGFAYGVQSFQKAQRGKNEFAAPNMFMADLGTSVGDSHYLNLDTMGTFEKWTFTDRGYPLTGQVGEERADGSPFVDAQHPHNSPIMGLTLSDTIRLNSGSKDHLKLYFAPRGESGDGPVAFMHRPTGVVNPDAPLGHHVAQDVGHISSTVLGASLNLGSHHIEASAFNGEEPQPTSTSLEMGSPNSYALRYVRDFSVSVTAMISAAAVKSSGHHATGLERETRYSASVYTERPACGEWTLLTASIVGFLAKRGDEQSLLSFGEEFLLKREGANIFGRLEALERSADELFIPGTATPADAKWMGALTLGYSRALLKMNEASLDLGASATLDALPAQWSAAYGGQYPWTARVFLRFGGMKMWDL